MDTSSVDMLAAITVQHAIESIIFWSILILLGVSHIMHLAYELLGAPEWLVRHVEKRRLREARHVLEQLGLGDEFRDNARAAMIRNKLGEVARYPDAVERGKAMLKHCALRETSNVGQGETITLKYFIDVMSASTDPGMATECAMIIASHIARTRPNSPRVPFDRVVGLKQGSPTIAIAFAHKLQKPATLFRGRDAYKRNHSARHVADLFDGGLRPGERVVIVDDSTTGGRMVLDCIDALRQAKCHVEECWVLFEPLGKDARRKLKDQGVELTSVVRMDSSTVESILPD